ncbi:MAG: aspartate-semialdehyde dehydrogenase [Chloroflexota bacterium]|nr:MAG: aspartate-semialdehyde dehydrogenase [Chloroflexota bacterium]
MNTPTRKESSSRIPVVVLGATGSVGQRFVQLLDGHPWFEVVALTGSERTTGQTYAEACHWVVPVPMPAWAAGMPVLPSEPDSLSSGPAPRLAFSALPTQQARLIEPTFAQAGLAVCSNASAYRDEPDVPILLPEVNPDHTGIIATQRRQRGWAGCIVTNSNCTSTGLTVALKALQDAFGLRRLFVVSMQAVSGAGYPGVPSLDIIDNVIPYIGGEEVKVESEPRKMLGRFTGDALEDARFSISAHTNRVAVTDGHLVCASVELDHPVSVEEAAQALRAYAAPAVSRHLPSAPLPVIVVKDEPDRPQPRLDRQAGDGMATVVGRLRPDPLFHLKMVVLSHNTIRGAAGGSIYNAELLVETGYL